MREPLSPPDPDDLLGFAPVPSARNRRDGWTEQRQREFITALTAMGSVRYAAQAVGMSKASLYKLLQRPDATSFATAVDHAASTGRARMFEYAMERALNGVTAIRILPGAALEVTQGRDRQMMMAAIKVAPPRARITNAH